MRWLCLIYLLLCPAITLAQSRNVLPSELSIRVEVEERDHTPLAREMIMIRIHGTYRRHITREDLKQPDLAGFNWSQLGPDRWWEERIDGKQVKRFERRMALFPDKAGELTIGAFTHQLTLTDEGDDWFEHQIESEPLTLKVDPAPSVEDWWFPTRRLRISDKWSNAPDQLTPGEGVLRIVQIEALGVTPEMMPPMPELTSPSAMIFAHPEKRLVELSPQGPVTHAFWRWTIRPSNDTSAIVEPIRFSYFDSTARQHHEVAISAQRVAYTSASAPTPERTGIPTPARLPGWRALGFALCVFAAGLIYGLAGWRLQGTRALRRFALFDPLRRRLRWAARKGDPASTRQAAAALIRRDGPDADRLTLLDRLDRAIFAPGGAGNIDLPGFARGFANSTRKADTNG